MKDLVFFGSLVFSVLLLQFPADPPFPHEANKDKRFCTNDERKGKKNEIHDCKCAMACDSNEKGNGDGTAWSPRGMGTQCGKYCRIPACLCKPYACTP